MDYTNIMNAIFVGLYLCAVVFFLVAMTKINLAKKRGRKLLKESILSKIQNSIPLTALDVNAMARGVDLSRLSITKCINELLLSTSDPTIYVVLQKLSGDLEKAEPFEDLPIEVKPSLLRLQELIDTSPQHSDAHLLSPIQRALGSYVEQKKEFESSKRVGKWMNAVSLIGFIIGLWGFYFAWKTPDSNEIETIVRKVAASSALSTSSASPSPAQRP